MFNPWDEKQFCYNTLMNKLFSRLKSSGKFLAYIPIILLTVTHTLLTKMSRLIQLTQVIIYESRSSCRPLPEVAEFKPVASSKFLWGSVKAELFSFLRIFVTNLSVMTSSHANNFYLVYHSRWKNTKRRRKLTLSRGHQLYSIKLLPHMHNGHELRKFFRNVLRKRQQSTTT